MARTQLDVTSIIKPYVEVDDEEVVEKEKGLTPFDFIKSVSNTKTDLIAGDPEIEKQYNAFITNRGFGYFMDTVLYANQMNMHADIPQKAQYYYYMHSLRKQNRFSKWHKLTPNPDLQLIQQVYNVRTEVAKEYLKILSKDDLKKLKALTETGEGSKKK